MQKGAFEGRFLSKLSKIDKQEIENFLSHVVREKHFLEIIFNAMLDGIIVLRPNLEVLYTNNAALDLLSIGARRRIIGERISALVEPGEFRDLVSRFALHRERVVNSEVEVPGPQQRFLFVTIIPLEGNSDPTLDCVIVILHDVTQAHKHAEEKRRAERATTLATLTAGLAHEIKNPLNSLNIHAQLLQRSLCEGEKSRKTDKQRIQQSSEIIVEEIKRLSEVVDTFLRATRPTRPLMQLGNINRMVERVAATMRPEIENCGVLFHLRLDHDIPTVEFDPNQMTQALLNLLKNSLDSLCGDDTADSKHRLLVDDAVGRIEAPQGRRIELQTQLVDQHYVIRVVDNGKGIPAEDLKKIFEPYFTTKFSGTGLGLSIVTRIVEEHAGHLEIESNPGRGTSITLSFPLDARPVRLLGQRSDESRPQE